MRLPIVSLSIAFASLLLATRALAAPTLVTVELERAQVGSMFPGPLAVAEDDPGGVLVPATAAATWFTAGFKAGDVIRTVDGTPASGHVMLRDGVTMFEIDRGGSQIIMRVLIHSEPIETTRLSEADVEDVVQQMADPDLRSTVVRRGKAVHGVRIIDVMMYFRLHLDLGDIVRTIDGKPILSPTELATALSNLKIGTSRIELERFGRPVTVEVTREAPIQLSKIKRVSATRFEVPREIADAISGDLFIAARKVESVPVVANNVVRGTRIYNVEPTSPAAAFGLRNGDVILDVEGRSIATISDAAETVLALAAAAKVVVHVERNGKRLAITYVIK